MRYLWWIVLPTIIYFALPFAPVKPTRASHEISSAPEDSIETVGKKVFYASCYSCHKDSAASLAPGPGILGAMTPRAVLAALENGKMRVQGAGLSDVERKAVAQWLTRTKLKENALSKEAFTRFSLPAGKPVNVYSGWGGNKESTGFRTTAQAGISLSNVSSLKLKWAFAFPDATIVRSKPAVVGDWLLVGGQFGDLFAIHKKTGKLGWRFEAAAAIRGAIVVEKQDQALTVYFADYSSMVYAVNVRTGKLIWSKRAGFEAQSANTGSVAVYNGIVYVPITSLEVALAANGNYVCCTSSGAVVALSARTGDEIWHYRVIPGPAKESGKKKNGNPVFGPSGAPVWCSPTVDSKRGLLYIGTGENYSQPTTNSSDAVQALDLKTGKLIWSFQATAEDAYNTACPFLTNCPDKAGPDLDFGMAPILARKKDGKDILLAGQKSGVVHALNPDNGKIVWQQRIGKGGALGGIHWGMATDGKYLFAANADNLYAIDKRDSTKKPRPGVYALDISSGDLIWITPSPASQQRGLPAYNSAAPAVMPGVVFAGTTDGHIRAYASADGQIIWDFNTVTDFETTNGIKGKGGSLDGPAPVVSDGMLFVNSGYGMFGQIPGNVLLAFEVQKK
ncbi:MAG TPA: PQQ-binding-like beta-propeller repeat protein [Puia sp.]|nr:PQQ-binding-like beta-propeller repeat protein [Puia sp.]